MAESESGGKRGAKPSSGKRPAKSAGPARKPARGGVSRQAVSPRTAPPAKPPARAKPTATVRSAAKPASPAGPKSAAKKGAAVRVARSRRTPSPRAKAPRAGAKAGSLRAAEARTAVPALSEEDQIRSAKYLPRDLPPRIFEEERFLFPETYGVNRVRLLVKDPDWLFAHWDVDPKVLDAMKKSMGERAMALSRLTLRVVDPGNGGSSDILLPAGARGWYIRADAARRSYKAELGVTLPSGEFRRLAESNVVVTPRVGPSREGAQRRITFGQAGRLPREAALSQRQAELESAASGAGPWKAPSVDASAPKVGGPGRVGTGSGSAPSTAAPSGPGARGGASDTFRPGGASDVHRR